MKRAAATARRARLLVGGLALIASAATGASPAAADHGKTTCQGQNVPITKYSLAEAEPTSLCLLNLYRQANGLEPLVLHESLATAARRHSEDMVTRDYFHHYAPAPAPNGVEPRDRATSAGYPEHAGVGENIAAFGDPEATPHDLFNGWKASEGHNCNMLSATFDVQTKSCDPLLVPYAAAAVGLALGAPEITAEGRKLGPDGVTGTQLFGTEAEGASDTALDDLAGGNPNSTAGCEPAKAERNQAKKAWSQAIQARRRAQKQLKQADSQSEREELAQKLQHKRKQVAKRRAALRRATAKQKALC